jgi:enoyl-CoA hydratase
LPATDDLLVEPRDGGALWLTFNRPAVFNAFSGELSVALAERLEDAASNDDVRVVVITGTGPAFSAGADISGEDAHERFDVRALDAANRIVRAVTGCPKPVVAALAEPLTAREAYDAGLVSHVAPDAEFPALVDKIVRRLTQGAPLAQAATKKAVNAATLDQLEAALERERTGQTVLLRTDDAAEGMRAFNEQRRPDFRGS